MHPYIHTPIHAVYTVPDATAEPCPFVVGTSKHAAPQLPIVSLPTRTESNVESRHLLAGASQLATGECGSFKFKWRGMACAWQACRHTCMCQAPAAAACYISSRGNEATLPASLSLHMQSHPAHAFLCRLSHACRNYSVMHTIIW